MTLPRPLGQQRPAPVSGYPPDDPLASPHVRALALEIAYRLRPFCGHLSEGDLVKLVTRLALAQQAKTPPGHSARP